MWADEANHAKMLPVIAKDSGMDESATAETMATFVFPSVEDRLSDKWLDGGAQDFMKGVADVFVNAGSLDSALDSYTATVDAGPLTTASGM
jgi:taurine transport system substrate-binding protein